MGSRFGQAHPGLASSLAQQGVDPDVERLLEGFAFLTARIRERAEDCVPDMAQELAELLMPGYVRPLPACTVVAFGVDPAATRGRQKLRRGVRVLSAPQDGGVCEFRTTQDCEVLPLTLCDSKLTETGARTANLRLYFSLPSHAADAVFQPAGVRLFCAQAYPQASNLWLALLRHTVAIEAEAGGRSVSLPPTAISCPGFDASNAMLPGFPRPHRLVQEYFACAKRFLFLDIGQLDALREVGRHAQEFVLQFALEGAPELLGPLPRDALRLHCAPAINLFAAHALPLRNDTFAQEHLLRPEGHEPSHAQVYAVDEVTALAPQSGQRRSYQPFGNFAHLAPGGAGHYFRLRREHSPVDHGVDTYLTALTARGAPHLHEKEIISADLLCTNRWLANKLRQGDLDRLADASQVASVRNITDSSAALAPPLGQELYWQLLAHMALAHRGVQTVENMRERLTLCDLQSLAGHLSGQVNERRIDALKKLQRVRSQRLIRGIAVGGVTYTATLQQTGFASQGDAYLCGLVLDGMMADEQSINSYYSLQLELQPTRKTYLLPFSAT